MTPTRLPTLEGIEQSLILAEQRCDALRANLDACFRAKSQEGLSTSKQCRTASHNDHSDSSSLNATGTNPGEYDDNLGKIYGGPPIRPTLLEIPVETLKNKEKGFEAGDPPGGSSTLQKLQDLLMSIPVVQQLASLSSRASRPATPVNDKDISSVTEFTDSTKEDQCTAYDETSLHTDNDHITKDDFLSADERPLSSCKENVSEYEDDTSEKSSKMIENSLPNSPKHQKPRSIKQRRFSKHARRTDIDRVYSARLVKTPPAGNSKSAQPAQSPRTAVPDAVKLLVRSLSESKWARRRMKKTAEWTVVRRQKQPRFNVSPFTSRRSEPEVDQKDQPTYFETTEKIRPEVRLGAQHSKNDFNQADSPGSCNQLPTEQGCYLLDETSSTNQHMGGPTACIRSHSTVEGRRPTDANRSVFDVHHSYERPTLSSQLKRVERKLSVQDIHKEITKRNEYPFVVATATTPSHNVNLSGVGSRHASRTDLSKCRLTSDDLARKYHEVQQKQSKTDGILELKHFPSPTSTTASGYESQSIESHHLEESYLTEKGGSREDLSLPVSFTRLLRCVLERLRTEMLDLATQRALASSNVPGTGSEHPQPSLLAPNTGIMQAKLKWKRAGKMMPDAMNKLESIQAVEQLDRKLQATEDQVYIIVTLCQEVEKMKEQLMALHRRVSSNSIANVAPPPESRVQAQEVGVGLPAPRRLRGCQGPSSRRTTAQNLSRSSSAIKSSLLRLV